MKPARYPVLPLFLLGMVVVLLHVATRVGADPQVVQAPILALCLVGVLLHSLRVHRRVERLRRAVERLERGDHGVRVPDRRNDDLGGLERSVNRLAASLHQHAATIERQRAALASASVRPGRDGAPAAAAVSAGGSGARTEAPADAQAPAVASRQEIEVPPQSALTSSPTAADRRARIEAALKRGLPLRPRQRVLLIDDRRASRQVLADFVRARGASCQECDRADRVYRLIEEYSPQLIVLDMLMPELNGWELLMHLKENRATAAIQVAFVSIQADEGRVWTLGSIDAVRKPIDRQEFSACILRTLGTDTIRHRSVLIVDDFIEFHEVIKAWIGEDTNDIRTAADGREALEILQDFMPEVIFLDIMMPVMDGFTFLHHLRRDEQLAHIPVVVITGKILSRDEIEQLYQRASSALSDGGAQG